MSIILSQYFCLYFNFPCYQIYSFTCLCCICYDVAICNIKVSILLGIVTCINLARGIPSDCYTVAAITPADIKYNWKYEWKSKFNLYILNEGGYRDGKTSGTRGCIPHESLRISLYNYYRTVRHEKRYQE